MTQVSHMSIYVARYQLFGPVTGGECHAFVRVRPRKALPATGFVATVGDAADETVTSEGRCPR
ncbi:hypothetical protein Ato02nite_041650 [Paractinoplanes toevensis]|uniref:Uncharacterized protein n=1 Tax=Paractinoplanes toevensis TaxID=571911 RepID=A0A919W1E2_9ACTN|nr:hypothetical protein Ato02nite_041650 [Actinoplanes toevensis]